MAGSVTRDWADDYVREWLETDAPPGRAAASCPADEFTLRRHCAHCLAELLRQVVAQRGAE